MIWKRYGKYGIWAAHAFVNDKQLCKTHHPMARGLSVTGPDQAPTGPKDVPLSPAGLPYGKICARCMKLSRAQRTEAT